MQIHHIYLSPDHNFYKNTGNTPGSHPTLEVPSVECIAGKSLLDDRFFDYKPDFKGQVTFFEQETHAWLIHHLQLHPSPQPSVYRRNIITSGLNLNDLIGREFTIQGIRFLGTEEARPCRWMDEVLAPGAEQALRGRGGLRAKILTTGTLSITLPDAPPLP
jgi:hypothetical protein